MARYELPDPKCDHVRKGIVQSGDPKNGPHCATNVCDRDKCIEDAMEWATAFTHLPARHVRD